MLLPHNHMFLHLLLSILSSPLKPFLLPIHLSSYLSPFFSHFHRQYFPLVFASTLLCKILLPPSCLRVKAEETSIKIKCSLEYASIFHLYFTSQRLKMTLLRFFYTLLPVSSYTVTSAIYLCFARVPPPVLRRLTYSVHRKPLTDPLDTHTRASKIDGAVNCVPKVMVLPPVRDYSEVMSRE